jgi:nickel/cobalt exporter
VTHITQIISFSLIILLGLIIFLKSMYKWIKKPLPSQTRRFANPYITALAVGIIPCPGVVMVMLFTISLNLTWLGILLGIFISIGMATTISGSVILGISGKSAVLSVTSNHKKLFAIIEPAIETIAGLLITGLGLFFLLTLS